MATQASGQKSKSVPKSFQIVIVPPGKSKRGGPKLTERLLTEKSSGGFSGSQCSHSKSSQGWDIQCGDSD